MAHTTSSSAGAPGPAATDEKSSMEGLFDIYLLTRTQHAYRLQHETLQSIKAKVISHAQNHPFHPVIEPNLVDMRKIIEKIYEGKTPLPTTDPLRKFMTYYAALSWDMTRDTIIDMECTPALLMDVLVIKALNPGIRAQKRDRKKLEHDLLVLECVDGENDRKRKRFKTEG